MPTLIYYNQSGHKEAQREATAVAARFTDLLTDYQTLGLPAAVTTADLPTLLADPAIWLVQKWMADSTFSLGGLPMNPNKVLELLERPPGFDSFIAKGKKLAEDLRPSSHTNRIVCTPASYAVSGGWEVGLTAAAATALEAQYKYYTTNVRQDALLADLLTMCDMLVRITGNGALHSSHVNDKLLNGALLVSEAYGVQAVTARPNPDFILSRFKN